MEKTGQSRFSKTKKNRRYYRVRTYYYNYYFLLLSVQLLNAEGNPGRTSASDGRWTTDEVCEGVERSLFHRPVSDCLPFIRPAESKTKKKKKPFAARTVDRPRLFIVYNNWEKQINVIGFFFLFFFSFRFRGGRGAGEDRERNRGR